MTARALVDGDAASVDVRRLEQIYREQADFVWRTVQRFGVAPAHAEDVVHEVFLVVQRRMADYDPSASLRAWLWGIARGVAANHRRARERAAQRERASLEVVQPLGSVSPEDELARARAVEVVRGFLATLPADKRTVFELADIEGFAGPEIARLLDIGVDQVYARLRTARRRFRAHLDALADESRPL